MDQDTASILGGLGLGSEPEEDDGLGLPKRDAGKRKLESEEETSPNNSRKKTQFRNQSNRPCSQMPEHQHQSPNPILDQTTNRQQGSRSSRSSSLFAADHNQPGPNAAAQRRRPKEYDQRRRPWLNNPSYNPSLYPNPRVNHIPPRPQDQPCINPRSQQVITTGHNRRGHNTTAQSRTRRDDQRRPWLNNPSYNPSLSHNSRVNHIPPRPQGRNDINPGYLMGNTPELALTPAPTMSEESQARHWQHYQQHPAANPMQNQMNVQRPTLDPTINSQQQLTGQNRGYATDQNNFRQPWRPQNTYQQHPAANQIPNQVVMQNQMTVGGTGFVDHNNAPRRPHNSYQQHPMSQQYVLPELNDQQLLQRERQQQTQGSGAAGASSEQGQQDRYQPR